MYSILLQTEVDFWNMSYYFIVWRVQVMLDSNLGPYFTVAKFWIGDKNGKPKGFRSINRIVYWFQPMDMNVPVAKGIVGQMKLMRFLWPPAN